MSNTEKTRQQRYKERNKAKRYVFELHLNNERECSIAEILDEAKANKSLKELVMNAVENYDIKNI